MRQYKIEHGRVQMGVRIQPDLIAQIDQEAEHLTGGNRSAMIERILEERYGIASPMRTIRNRIEQRFTPQERTA